MIQAYTDDRLVIGVTQGNIDLLTAGRPMRVQILPNATVREILVVFGKDKPAILKQLEDAGMDIADAMKASAAADPL